MEETRDDAGPSEKGAPNAAWWNPDFMEKFGSLSFGAREDSSTHRESPRSELECLSSETASQILWSTGVLSEPIPNGFYSVIPVCNNICCLLFFDHCRVDVAHICHS